MLWRDNPLITELWRRQVRLRTLHQSSLFAMSLGLLIAGAALFMGVRRGSDLIWVKLTLLSLVLFFLTLTIATMLSVGGTMLRWRRSGRLAEIMETTMSSATITWGVLAPTVIGLGVFWTLLVILIQLLSPLRLWDLNAASIRLYGEYAGYLWFTVPAAWAQILFTAAVTLLVSLRRSSFLSIFGWSFALVFMAPALIVRMIVPSHIHPPPREIAIIQVDAIMLAPIKVIISTVIIIYLMRRLRDRCRLDEERSCHE